MHDRSASLRTFFASYVSRSGRAHDPRIERAFAAVMREPFVGPGPWSIAIPGARAGAGYVKTPDADIAFIYQDTLVALDPSRGINIGQPSAHAGWLNALAPAEGESVRRLGRRIEEAVTRLGRDVAGDPLAGFPEVAEG